MPVLFVIGTFEVGLTMFRRRTYIRDLRDGKKFWPERRAVDAFYLISEAARSKPLTFDQRQHVMLMAGLGFVATAVDPSGYTASRFLETPPPAFVDLHAHAFDLASDDALGDAFTTGKDLPQPQPSAPIYDLDDLPPGPWDRHPRYMVGAGWYLWGAQDSMDLWVLSIPSSGPIKAEYSDCRKFWAVHSYLTGDAELPQILAAAHVAELRYLFCRCVANHRRERAQFRDTAAEVLAGQVVATVRERAIQSRPH